MTVRALLVGVSIAALGSVAASAADLYIPTTPQPIYEAAGFDWEGLYIGARVGGESYNNIGYGVIGAAVGVNFIPVDPFLLGLEATGDYIWGNGFGAGEFFANIRAGAIVTDAALVYAIGGVGVYTSNGVTVSEYQLGGGVEFAWVTSTMPMIPSLKARRRLSACSTTSENQLADECQVGQLDYATFCNGGSEKGPPFFGMGRAGEGLELKARKSQVMRRCVPDLLRKR
jgi:outer membrane immunogenic protein